MLLRIVGDLALEEVMKKIRKFEKEFGMSFEKLEDLFLGISLILSLQGLILSGLSFWKAIKATLKMDNSTMLLKGSKTLNLSKLLC
jgi:hypothetical protein